MPSSPIEIAPGIVHLSLGIANAYLVGEPSGPWALVDTGLPGHAAGIRRAAEARFGCGRPPAAILLTHGHADHSGSARVLAETWGVPIYAHRMELPYLDGRDTYAPGDPTVGGLVANLGRFFPVQKLDLGSHLEPLPEDGSVPGLPGWRVVETPGHSPGHVSYFRGADSALLAGDACATVDLSGWHGPLAGPAVGGPPPPFTPDWGTAIQSLRTLAALSPRSLACGHGKPLLQGAGAALRSLAETLRPPDHGRYVQDPARWDENGITYLPPAPFDPVPLGAAALATAAVALGVWAATRSATRREYIPVESRLEERTAETLAPKRGD